MNELTQTTTRTLNFFDAAQMDTLQRAAVMFANSDLVPDMYKVGGKLNNPEKKAIANCVIAMNMAQRMNADVLMIMQNLVIIYGRPSWSSAFLISSVNSSGRFEPLKYRFENKGKVGEIGGKNYDVDNIECVAYTKAKGSDELLESSPISIAMAIKEGWFAKNGSKWQTMPQQMLMYRSASFWVRAYAPEISMGMHTTEEVQDMNTIEADFEVVEEKVKQEIAKKANKEAFEMPQTESQQQSADGGQQTVESQSVASVQSKTESETPSSQPSF